MSPINRRTFTKRILAIGLPAAIIPRSARTAAKPAEHAGANPVLLFEKPVQSLGYDRMAAELSRMGFQGIEATVRRNGHIPPERAADLLPAMAEALGREGLQSVILATDITRADSPHAANLLRAASELGIRHYRLGGLKYHATRPIRRHLDSLRPQLRELAALNRELHLTALYQNHAGSANIGGPIWDLDFLLDDISPDDIGVAYDIRHAMVEGSSAWPVSFRLILPRIRAVYVKDFVFDQRGRARNVPMGTGIVGKAFYQTLIRSGFKGPISLHVPHLKRTAPNQLEDSLKVIHADLKVLREHLQH